MNTETAEAFDKLTTAIAQERASNDAYVAVLRDENRKQAARIRELEGALRSITSEAEGASNFLRNEFAGFVSIDTAQRLERLLAHCPPRARRCVVSAPKFTPPALVRCEPCCGRGYKSRWRNTARGRAWKVETCRSCGGRGEREPSKREQARAALAKAVRS